MGKSPMKGGNRKGGGNAGGGAASSGGGNRNTESSEISESEEEEIPVKGDNTIFFFLSIFVLRILILNISTYIILFVETAECFVRVLCYSQ